MIQTMRQTPLPGLFPAEKGLRNLVDVVGFEPTTSSTPGSPDYEFQRLTTPGGPCFGFCTRNTGTDRG